jgi:hypothetical protein
MNETTPQPEHTQENPVEKTLHTKIENMNDVINERIDSFNEQQEYEQKLEEAKHSLEERKNRTQDAYLRGTTFTADRAPKQASSFKKIVLWGSMALGLSSLAKEAAGQQKINTDKEGIKNERVKSIEDGQELTEQEKADWGAYVTYTKEHHFDKDPRMNNRAFAHQVLEDFIKSLNGHPTTVNQEQVIRIQKEFATLREWILKKIKNHEKINGHYVELEEGVTEDQFMAHLSNTDAIAGPQTLRYFGADYVQMIKELKIHLNDLTGKEKGIDVEYMASVQKMPLISGEFVSMKENKDEK